MSTLSGETIKPKFGSYECKIKLLNQKDTQESGLFAALFTKKIQWENSKNKAIFLVLNTILDTKELCT